MNKRFITDRKFVNYIKQLGFQHHVAESDKKYYTNSLGNQIKIDYDNGIITLLNAKGNVVDYSSSFTDTQINKFAENDNT